MSSRALIQDLITANPVYANGIVTAYTVDEFGAKTSTKADLYSSTTGTATLANPQTLDAYGKFRQPVYIEEPVILNITGLGNAPDHDTGVIGGQSWRDVVISAAEMLALHTTPKTLIAAPGAGKVVVLNRAVFFLDYNSAAFASVGAGDDIEIRYTNASGVIAGTLETTGFLDQTADKYALVPPNTSNLILPANAPLVASLAGQVTTGNSPVAVRIFYDIVDLSTLLTT